MDLDKNKTALLVMDFMNDLVDEKGKAAGFCMEHIKKQDAIANTKKALEKARAKGWKVIYVTLDYGKNYEKIKTVKSPMYQGVADAKMFETGTWGTEIHKDLKPMKGETIITKSRINPFTNPDFEKEIKGMENLVMAGVATNFVVEAAAREAADKDYNVIVLEDCCASMSPDMHKFSVEVLLPNLVMIKSVGDI